MAKPTGQVQIDVGNFNPEKNAGGGLFTIAGHVVTVIELGLAVLAFVFLFIMLILAGLLGAKSASGQADLVVCDTPRCRMVGGQFASFMNDSVNPCDDFQEYACGKYFESNTIVSPENEKTVYSILQNSNNAKIQAILGQSIVDRSEQSFERKVKLFFKTCTNDYQSNKVKGDPLLSALDEANKGNFYLWQSGRPTWVDFNYILQKVHIDYWTDAFFTFSITPNSFNRDRYDIQISTAGLGMSPYSYIYPRRNVTQNYKKYMQTVTSLLIRDKGVSVPQTYLDTFLDDVYSVEYQLANITLSAEPPDEHPHLETELQTLGSLNLKVTQINFVDFFKNMFQTNIDSDTKVIVVAEDYLKRVSAYINMLLNAKGTVVTARMLTNYMSWRLIQRYATYLSYDYVHANREYYEDQTGSSSFLGNYAYCFQLTTNAMRHALGSLFVQDHFSDAAQTKAVSVVQDLRATIVSQINQIPWMDGSTKLAAIKKLNAITVKLGYPQEAVNKTFVNSIYEEFEISSDSFFGNILNWNKYLRLRWRDLWSARAVDRGVWRYRLFDVHAGTFNPWNEIMVPAGMLQWPIFGDGLPHYVNYGAVGVIIAHEFVSSIDEIGGYFTDTGKYEDWWTNKTTQDYLVQRRCTTNYYANMTAGPYNIQGNNYIVPFNQRMASQYARFGIAETGALRIAFNAYKDWVKKNGQEPILLGSKLTQDQSFFVSYAQTNCFNRRPLWSFYMARRGTYPENLRGNGAMAQYDQFAKTFNCPVGSRMNVQNRCNIF